MGFLAGRVAGLRRDLELQRATAGSNARRVEELQRRITRPRNDALEACRHDRVAFARHVGMEPVGWQQEVLRSTGSRKLLNCSRQSGKTTVTGIIAAHKAIFEPNSMIVMLASVERQAGELFRRMKRAYRNARCSIPIIRDSALQLELANGSRVVALPGKESNVRSISSVDLLAIDESSRVLDELYATVRPMLAVSGGDLISMSSPFGARGWWYEAWRGPDAARDVNLGPVPAGTDEWERWQIPADMCPRIAPEFLEEERRNLGEWWFLQEYFCRFLDAKTAAFRAVDIEAAFVEDVDQWNI